LYLRVGVEVNICWLCPAVIDLDQLDQCSR
jgi:hypothetical protein